MKLARVVVGVDGSDNAARALELAIAIAEPAGAEVIAVHALGLLDRLDAEPVPTATHRDAIVAAFRDQWTAALTQSTVASERIVADGPPADVILATAAEADADLVVVGERGIGTTPERMLGSTSHRVLSASDRPVLIVPEQRGG